MSRTMAKVGWLCMLALLGSCGRFGFEPGFSPNVGETNLDASDADGRVAREAGSGDGQIPHEAGPSDAALEAGPVDSSFEASTGTCSDGMRNQGELFVDSGGPCSIRAPRCDEGTDPWTVGLFDFEDLRGTTVEDRAGTADGTIVNSPLTSPSVDCGVAFAGTGMSYVTFGSPASWRPASGSIDLRLRMTGDANQVRGLVSADATAAADGHFILALSPDRRVVARLQTSSRDYFRCSEQIAEGNWVHVGVNWGSPGLELFVDGQLATYSGTIPFYPGGAQITCATDMTGVSIDRANTAWVFAALNYESTSGANDMITGPIGAPGAIDHVRISSIRRDFTRD